MNSLKPHFSRALGDGQRLHLNAHSHHLWPNVTHDAQLQAWNDAATLWDEKWDRVWGEIVPEAQSHIARHLNIPDPASIALAPNTHEFLLRLFSALPEGARVLATDSEFYSFARQAARFVEDGRIALTTVPTAPFASFAERFAKAASTARAHIVYVSQVFFNSGFAIADLAALVAAIPGHDALIVIDGYHGFMARPTDLAAIAHRAFYLGGGYKYAMAGEGAGYMLCPPDYVARPPNTGWFAGFGALTAPSGGGVSYASDARRFWGATFDPTGLYRLNAVMRWLAQLGIDTASIHTHAAALQENFIPAMEAKQIPGLRRENLVVDGQPRGNFLAYRSPHAARIQQSLARAGIVTDSRADVLRIGFGLYHDRQDIPEIATRIAAALG